MQYRFGGREQTIYPEVQLAVFAAARSGSKNCDVVRRGEWDSDPGARSARDLRDRRERQSAEGVSERRSIDTCDRNSERSWRCGCDPGTPCSDADSSRRLI